MKRLLQSVVLMLGLGFLGLGAMETAMAQQGGTWKRELIYEGQPQAEAGRLRDEINAGNRGGELKNAEVVPDAREGLFAVTAERFTPAERPVQPTVNVSDTLRAPSATQRGIMRYTKQLTPGSRYIVELASGSGATRDGKALAGFFDPTLLVEDGDGRPLNFNDDIKWPQNCNARVSITVPASGTVRIVVSSYRTGESGTFTVLARPE